MKLTERFWNIIKKSQTDRPAECEKIADEHAIEFADWCASEEVTSLIEDLIIVEKLNKVPETKELLQIFKKRKRFMKTKTTKQSKVTDVIKALEIGQSFNKKEFVISVWGQSDYFVYRSFDVLFSKAKKELIGREFKTEKGFIIRTK